MTSNLPKTSGMRVLMLCHFILQLKIKKTCTPFHRVKKKVVEERKQIKSESCSEMFNIDYYEELKIAIANTTRGSINL